MPIREETARQNPGISAESIANLMELFGGEPVSYIYASIKSDAVNSETGMLEDTDDGIFGSSSLVESIISELADGEITIAYETFLNDPDDSDTRTRLYAAGTNTRSPILRST